MKGTEKITIKDVAKKSGYSVATVSAVINDVPIVSERSKNKILQVIEEMGYRPNTIARSLKKSKTSTLAIIVRDITNPFYPELISGIEEIAWSKNYEVFLCNTENDTEKEQKYIDNLISKQVDGVFIATSALDRIVDYSVLSDSNIPYVFVNRKPDVLVDNEWFVGTDNYSAVSKAIQYMKQKGIKDIAFYAGPQEFWTFKQRLTAFKETMLAEGLKVKDEWIFIGEEFNQQTGYDNTLKLLQTNHLPECIFCSTDPLAFGAYKALSENNINVPKDMYLMGTDNNKFGELIGLSSIDMNNKKLGREAAEILIDLLKNSGTQKRNEIILQPELIIRSSC